MAWEMSSQGRAIGKGLRHRNEDRKSKAGERLPSLTRHGSLCICGFSADSVEASTGLEAEIV